MKSKYVQYTAKAGLGGWARWAMAHLIIYGSNYKVFESVIT